MRIGGKGPCKQQEHVVDGYNGSPLQTSQYRSRTPAPNRSLRLFRNTLTATAPKVGRPPNNCQKDRGGHSMPRHAQAQEASGSVKWGRRRGNTAVSPSPRLAC